MEIRELFSFYHVSRLRSVSKAAQYLGIGQPTVTTHIKKIEKEFGIVLFDRIKRPIRLTPDGAAFYELARPVVDNVMGGMELLKTEMDSHENRGSLSLGAYTDVILYHLPTIVKEFRDRNPRVQIRLTAGTYASLMELSLSGELDLMIGTRPQPDNQSLEFRPLFPLPFVLLTPRGHELMRLPEVTLADIARWPLIVLEPVSRVRRSVEQALRRDGLQYNIALEIPIVEIAKKYVEIGMGISIVSEYSVQPLDREKLGVRELTDIFPPAEMGLITLRGKFLGSSARSFVELLFERLGQPSRSTAATLPR